MSAPASPRPSDDELANMALDIWGHLDRTTRSNDYEARRVTTLAFRLLGALAKRVEEARV